VPLVLVLEALNELVEVAALVASHALEHVQDAWHHALQTAEVHVGTVVQQVKHLVSILLHLRSNRGRHSRKHSMGVINWLLAAAYSTDNFLHD
jgi:hypothetical protein